MPQSINIPNLDIECLFIGPPLSQKSIPTLIYFALSATDSLATPPFNSPITHLDTNAMRIISFTLPCHDDIGSEMKQGFASPEKALSLWADHFSQGADVLAPFIDSVDKALSYLISENLIDIDKLFVSGLSRGAFIATMLGAKREDIKYILGFAPLVDLSFAKEFDPLKNNPLVIPYDLKKHVDKLFGKTIRFYIGNHDERVETKESFDLIYACSKKASSHRIRSAPLELIIYPSIGHKGHGTPEEIFSAGAKWIKSFL